MFADQKSNMVSFERIGLGMKIEYSNLTETAFMWTVNEVLNNKKYQEKAKEISIRYRDRPETAVNTAKFWIDYVARHKGAYFMQSPALKLNFIEYYNVDVHGFLLFAFIVFVYLLYCIARILIWCICCTCRQSSNNKQKLKTN